MLHKILIIGLCLMLTACATGSKRSMSNKEKATLNLQMGARYLDMGMLEVAKEKLEKANELDSGNPEIHNALAVFYEKIKLDELAREHFITAMELSPENASIKNNYGRFLCSSGHFPEGVELLQQSVGMPLNERKWIALTNLGRCYLKQGELKKAEQAFRKALGFNPGFSPALQEMQKISYQQRKYMSARAFLERYLAVAKHTAETLWFAIQTERALGNKTLTEQYRQQLLALFPTSEQARQVRTAISK